MLGKLRKTGQNYPEDRFRQLELNLSKPDHLR
jgi:hypothetical protein